MSIVSDIPSPYEVTTDGPQAIISTDGNGVYIQQNEHFFELTCSNTECLWKTMSQKLKVGRDGAVLMYLPPDFQCQN